MGSTIAGMPYSDSRIAIVKSPAAIPSRTGGCAMRPSFSDPPSYKICSATSTPQQRPNIFDLIDNGRD